MRYQADLAAVTFVEAAVELVLDADRRNDADHTVGQADRTGIAAPGAAREEYLEEEQGERVGVPAQRAEAFARGAEGGRV